MGRKYRVVCEDGQVRHAEPFDDKRSAGHFAEWGHVCTATHRIELVPEIKPAEGLEYWTPDQVAECLDVSTATTSRLWELLGEVDRPFREWPEGIERGESVVAVWSKLTPAEQEEINAAYAKERM